MSDLPSSFRMAPDGIVEIVKSPLATLDYSIDWRGLEWLQTTENITAVSWAVPTGLTQGSPVQANGIATNWLSGGVIGTDYVVSATITTDAGRTDTRSFRILCRER